MNVVKVDEDGQCVKLGPDGKPVPGLNPKTLDELGPLNMLNKTDEDPIVKPTRGQFSKVVLNNLDSDDEEGANIEVINGPLPTQDALKPSDVRKVFCQFLLTAQKSIKFPVVEVEVKGLSSVRQVMQKGLKAMEKKEGDYQKMFAQQIDNGRMNNVDLENSITPGAHYNFFLEEKFVLREPFIITYKLFDDQGTEIAKYHERVEEAFVSPIGSAFKLFTPFKHVDFSSVELKQDDVSLNPMQALTKPGKFEFSMRTRAVGKEGNVFYHLKLISRQTFNIVCVTIECPLLPSFKVFWHLVSQNMKLDPTKIHKLGLQKPDGTIQDLNPDAEPAPFSFLVIAYSGKVVPSEEEEGETK